MGSISVTMTRAPWPAQRVRAALADVAVAEHDADLAADHHVGGAVDAVDERVAAAVEVVELRLGDRVVDVDGREQQLAGLVHLVEAQDAGGRLLGDPHDLLADPGPALRVLLQRAPEQSEHDLHLLVVGRVRARHGAGALVLGALVQQQRGVAAVVEEHVRAAVGPAQSLLRAPPVLLEGLALPGEDRDALRLVDRALGTDDRGGGGVVLGGEDVAAGPADLGAQGGEGLDQDGGLDGHVQRARDARALEGLAVGVLRARAHQPRHLVLGELDLATAEVGQREVGDLVVNGGGGSRRHSLFSRSRGAAAGTAGLLSTPWPPPRGIANPSVREADPTIGPTGRPQNRAFLALSTRLK